jgi:hypothetical protein
MKNKAYLATIKGRGRLRYVHYLKIMHRTFLHGKISFMTCGAWDEHVAQSIVSFPD